MFQDRIYTHLHNRNRDNRNMIKGSALWDGSWTLRFFRNLLRLTWAFGQNAPVFNIGVWFELVNEREIGATFAIKHLFYFSIAVHSSRFPWWTYKHGNRDLSLRIFDWGIWLDLWRDDDMPFRQRRLLIKPLDILFGREQYSQRSLETHNVIIPMPEKNYPATVELFISEWKRPRAFRAKQVQRANVELAEPIPSPGKGENSWDLDDDATFSLTCGASTVGEAVAALIKCVERDRKKYGGRHWAPQTTS